MAKQVRCVCLCFGGATERNRARIDRGSEGRGKLSEGVMGEVNNCGGLVAPIHTTDLILL